MHCEYHERYTPYLIQLGLYQIARMADIAIDEALIRKLVEQWRPETHIFHLPFEEMIRINYTNSNKIVIFNVLMTCQRKKLLINLCMLPYDISDLIYTHAHINYHSLINCKGNYLCCKLTMIIT